MFIRHTLRAVVLAAGVAGFAAAAARADECETMTKTVQVLIDEMKSAVGQLGALSLNDLRNLDIRHKNVIHFGAI